MADRRGPIIGGLILIGIGVLFLVREVVAGRRCRVAVARSPRWSSGSVWSCSRSGPAAERAEIGGRLARTMRSMDIPLDAQIGAISMAGILAGLWLLARGFGGYRTAIRIGDTGTSRDRVDGGR